MDGATTRGHGGGGPPPVVVRVLGRCGTCGGGAVGFVATVECGRAVVAPGQGPAGLGPVDGAGLVEGDAGVVMGCRGCRDWWFASCEVGELEVLDRHEDPDGTVTVLVGPLA